MAAPDHFEGGRLPALRRRPRPSGRRSDARAQPAATPDSRRSGEREHPDDRRRRLVEASFDAYVTVDSEGRILDWGGNASDIFGWDRREVGGQRLVLAELETGRPEGRDVSGLADDPGSGPIARRLVVPVIARDGRSVPYEVVISPFSERGDQRFDVVLRELTVQPPPGLESMCTGAIVQSSDAAIFSEGLDGRIATWNRAAQQIFGYSALEATGQRASFLLPPERQEEMEAMRQRARRGDHVHNHETQCLRSDGSRAEVAVTISPVLDAHDQVIAVSTIARDITDARRMAAALEAAYEQARDSEARTRQFLADAAHQLRNPLAGVRACADMLLRSESPEGRERLLGHLVNEAARAATMTTGLLRMARLDQGEVPVPSPCDVVALCRWEVERAHVQAPNLQFRVLAPVPFDEPVAVDGGIVGEILANLLDNARRYAVSTVDLGVGRHLDQLEITVADDGPGIPPRRVAAAFERFTSIDERSGSGLGLPIARALARCHGGDLDYDDKVFRLRLPLSGESIRPQECP